MGKSNAVDRVIQELREAVSAGAPGDRLPSVRELMARYGAGPGTVQRAVNQLVGEGLIEARPGRGSFVAPRRLRAERPADLGWQAVALGEKRVSVEGFDQLQGALAPGTIPLTYGYLSEDLQPISILAAAGARAARRPGAWGQVPVEGLEELRAWFAREVGASMRTHDVTVSPGGQAALSTIFRALVAPGSPVLFESPTYLGALVAARAAGLRPVPVPADEGGVRPELLVEAFASSGARLFYCQPTYASPSGATLVPERREAVLDAVRNAGAFLVEDDAARELCLEGEPPPPLASRDPDGHVVYVRSLAKSAAPGLRVAALCARGMAGARLRSTCLVDDFFVAGSLQETALEFVTSPAWRRHLRWVRSVLRARRDALVAMVRQRLPFASLTFVPRGGLHLWLEMSDDVDDVRVAAETAMAGVVVSAGRHWFPAEPPGSFLRLSYGGAETEVLSEGVDVLARVLSNVAGNTSRRTT